MAMNADGVHRTLDDEQIKDPNNSRGCGVPWPVLSNHYGVPIAELQQICGQPQWKDLEQPAQQQSGELDLWAADNLNEVL
jgi:hypothetical protein